MPAIKMIMKYSNVLPIFFCMGIVFSMIACDISVARKPLTPGSTSISLDVAGTQNHSSNCDLTYLSAQDQYYCITPGPVPIVRLFPLQPERTPTTIPLHAMDSIRDKQLYELDDKCFLVKCD